ncbi:hypothetical protein EUGRSUZ_J00033 [Eucalyptus grandis]|uniref:Uncharacterized protein n=2 Tax=Eucalyptus grandis TaxID=71139 RepID=A0ACC3J2E7_EUCGR|nr:hypothetical protein EUGRSUZ_J00033 [Eucalyptus grandis]
MDAQHFNVKLWISSLLQKTRSPDYGSNPSMQTYIFLPPTENKCSKVPGNYTSDIFHHLFKTPFPLSFSIQSNATGAKLTDEVSLMESF